MEVRPVTSLEEYRGAMAVNRTAWRDAYGHILPAEVLDGFTVPEGRELRERYDDARREGQTFLVAVGGADDGSAARDADALGVAGFAQFVLDAALTKQFVGDDEVGLRAVYVAPDRQGEGIGSRLLEAGVDRIPDDAEALVLEAFRDNDAARGFYDSRGFTVRGEATFEVAGEAYPTVMYEKSL
ncbi:GNAT family N-acetyltransferase [Halorarum halobium]|uniref:GNAT family N-acetyltransferase n=1 Tax=Halorarum halobium TaxID=3075121 RepID=UPI0028A96173|nr:GNAT family N-acetyltransferase [Halobaculum sp. XH14]